MATKDYLRIVGTRNDREDAFLDCIDCGRWIRHKFLEENRISSYWPMPGLRKDTIEEIYQCRRCGRTRIWGVIIREVVA